MAVDPVWLEPNFGLFCDYAIWYRSPRNALQRDMERAHAYFAERYSISDVGPGEGMPQAAGSGFSTRMRARICNGHHELKPGLRQMWS